MDTRLVPGFVLLGILAAGAPAAARDITLCNEDLSVCFCEGIRIRPAYRLSFGDEFTDGEMIGPCADGSELSGLSYRDPATGVRRFGLARTRFDLEFFSFVVRTDRTWSAHESTGARFVSGRWKRGVPSDPAAPSLAEYYLP